jgi:hypothetical protein
MRARQKARELRGWRFRVVRPPTLLFSTPTSLTLTPNPRPNESRGLGGAWLFFSKDSDCFPDLLTSSIASRSRDKLSDVLYVSTGRLEEPDMEERLGAARNPFETTSNTSKTQFCCFLPLKSSGPLASNPKWIHFSGQFRVPGSGFRVPVPDPYFAKSGQDNFGLGRISRFTYRRPRGV